MNSPLSLIVATQAVKANVCPKMPRTVCFILTFFAILVNTVKQIRNLSLGRMSPKDLNKKIVMAGLPQQWRNIG
jgi:hypothetical protein